MAGSNGSPFIASLAASAAAAPASPEIAPTIICINVLSIKDPASPPNNPKVPPPIAPPIAAEPNSFQSNGFFPSLSSFFVLASCPAALVAIPVTAPAAAKNKGAA